MNTMLVLINVLHRGGLISLFIGLYYIFAQMYLYMYQSEKEKVYSYMMCAIFFTIASVLFLIKELVVFKTLVVSSFIYIILILVMGKQAKDMIGLYKQFK